jgi:hypothetical protein
MMLQSRPIVIEPRRLRDAGLAEHGERNVASQSLMSPSSQITIFYS